MGAGLGLGLEGLDSREVLVYRCGGQGLGLGLDSCEALVYRCGCGG